MAFVCHRRRSFVESQLGLPAVLVGPVARVAILREDRSDVTVELNPGPLARFRRSSRGRNDQSRERHDRTGRGAEAAPGLTFVGSCDRHSGILPDRRPARSACLWASGVRSSGVFNTSFTIPDQAAIVTQPVGRGITTTYDPLRPREVILVKVGTLSDPRPITLCVNEILR